MKPTIFIGLGLAGFALLGCAQPPVPSGDPDTAFLQQSAREDLLEIQLGQLAERYARLPDVAAYGRHMAEDHEQALAALQRIAQDRQVALPTTLDPDQADTYHQLGGIGGNSFHRDYMDRELWAKRGELAALQQEATIGSDARLVAFARAREPVVDSNRQLGEQVEIQNGLNRPLPHEGGGRS